MFGFSVDPGRYGIFPNFSQLLIYFYNISWCLGEALVTLGMHHAQREVLISQRQVALGWR